MRNEERKVNKWMGKERVMNLEKNRKEKEKRKVN